MNDKPTSDQIADAINIDTLRIALTKMISIIAHDDQLSVKEKIDALSVINYTFGVITGAAA